MTKQILTLIAVVLTFSATTHAAEYDTALVTDRPDAAEASVTVGKQRFQVETSIGASHDTTAGVTTRTYNVPTLLRYGIIDPLEVRVEGDLFNIQTATATTTERGFSDLAFGVKGHFVENEGWIPSFGALAHLNVPTGKNTFSSNGVEPIAKLLADWELPAGFSLGTNLGADLPVRDAAGDKFARLLYAAALGHGIPGTQDRLRLFVESTGAIPMKSGKPDEHQFDTGLALLITPDMQLDVVTQIGLNDNTPDITGGLGFSWRL